MLLIFFNNYTREHFKGSSVMLNYILFIYLIYLIRYLKSMFTTVKKLI